MASQGFSISIVQDTLTPSLRKALKNARRPEPILRAAGTQIVSIAKRAFREPVMRQSTWAPKKDGSASNLIQEGVLSKSIRVTALTTTSVTSGSDRKYAAIHQLGGVIAPQGRKAVMPARPYLPFTAGGKLAKQALPKVRAAIERALAQQL